MSDLGLSTSSSKYFLSLCTWCCRDMYFKRTCSEFKFSPAPRASGTMAPPPPLPAPPPPPLPFPPPSVSDIEMVRMRCISDGMFIVEPLKSSVPAMCVDMKRCMTARWDSICSEDSSILRSRNSMFWEKQETNWVSGFVWSLNRIFA